MHDLAHFRTERCLSDCLTKEVAKPSSLIEAVEAGRLPYVDSRPLYRSLSKHKAFLATWLFQVLPYSPNFHSFLLVEASAEYQQQRRATPKQALACHSNSSDDIWIHDQRNQVLKRIHANPRNKRCVPVQATCPAPPNNLKSRRLTIAQPSATSIIQHADSWRQQGKKRLTDSHKRSGYAIFRVEAGMIVFLSILIHAHKTIPTVSEFCQ